MAPFCDASAGQGWFKNLIPDWVKGGFLAPDFCSDFLFRSQTGADSRFIPLKLKSYLANGIASRPRPAEGRGSIQFSNSCDRLPDTALQL